MSKNLLKITDISVEIESKQVIGGLNLSVGEGEIVAIMGANGSGKTSLAQVIMGNLKYEVQNPKQAKIMFAGKNLIIMSPDERSREGIYVAWQQPVAIPGVSVFSLCRASYQAMGNKIEKLTEFRQKLEALAERVGLTKEHIGRSINEGFSGGEKKRLELLQLLLLTPKLAILDEIDSGLDVDALRLVGEIIVEMKKSGTAFILITHYKRLLEYIEPDRVCVMKKGKIVEEGGMDLVQKIEERGYEKIKD